jgi:WhiB family redox-sensing transcriptional regulator
MSLSQKHDIPPKNGACKGQETSMWFPKMTRGTRAIEAREIRAKTKTAIEICNSCDVSIDCLEYSLRHEPYGIWGGKTEEERATIRSKRGIVASREGRIHYSGIGSRSSNGHSAMI